MAKKNYSLERISFSSKIWKLENVINLILLTLYRKIRKFMRKGSKSYFSFKKNPNL